MPPKKNNTRRKPPAKKPAPPKRSLCLLSGFLLGLAFMGLLQTWETPRQEAGRVLDKISEIIETGASVEETDPEFVFYTSLRDATVTVPDDTPLTDSRKSKVRKTQNAVFVLQAGSFRQQKDANRVRAQLILLNLVAHIEKSRARDGSTWHRVIVGPFHSSTKLANARATLLENSINNITMKRTAH